MIWSLVLLLIFAHLGFTFRVSVPDISPLIEGTANAELFLDISLQIKNLGSASSLTQCSICMAVNASTCHCYNESVSDLRPYLPPLCVSRPAPYHMSLYLRCGNIISSSTSIIVPKKYDDSTVANIIFEDKLSLVLPLDVGDLSRYAILLRSFTLLISATVLELLVIVPDDQYRVFSLVTQGFVEHLSFPVRIVAESILLPPPTDHYTYYPYAIQMSLKLLVARIILTQYYITLDADVVLVQDFRFGDVIMPDGRAIYQHEPRLTAHPEWWLKSESFLNMSGNIDKSLQGFGATPAVLSTFGSLLVLEKIREARGNQPEFIREWVSSFGVSAVWTEYTLYRTVLDFYQVKYT